MSSPEPEPLALSVVPADQPRPNRRPLVRRLIKLTLLVGLPILLIPVLLPRKVSARRLPRSASAARPATGTSLALERQIQELVDGFKARLAIADPVRVSIVDKNDLVVSVEHVKDGGSGFALAIEAGFLDGLTTGELEAVLAHELGHVWIFTHHPYLQTEELANQIAMRVVSQDTLASAYEKVWQRTGGRKGNLIYLPSAGSTSQIP